MKRTKINRRIQTDPDSELRTANCELRTGFTLMEMLIVVIIIMLIAGILIPALELVRQEMRSKLTQSNITLIATACDMFANDFEGQYPSSSDPGYIGLSHGKQIVVLLLTGYAGDDTDAGEPYDPGSETMSVDDGKAGFGFRTVTRGPVHGPYNGTEQIPTVMVGNYPVFADAFGNEILYYRADSGDFIKGHNPETVPYVDTTTAGDHSGEYDNRGFPYLITSPGRNESFDDYGSGNDDVKNVQNPE